MPDVYPSIAFDAVLAFSPFIVATVSLNLCRPAEAIAERAEMPQRAPTRPNDQAGEAVSGTCLEAT